MKKLLLMACMFLVGGMQVLNAQGKQDLRVLYVGGSPDMETIGVKVEDGVALAKSVKARMASFGKFLKSRFKTVKVMDAKEYVAAMSDDYDVTVFDGTPQPIKPEVREYGPDGRITKYERAGYLPDDFDRPALCIAEASETIGRSIGTKCDWFCLCLEADAHHWKKDHPVFNGPFKVDIRPVMKPTPEAAFEYGKIYGYELPAETEMWTVQTKSSSSDRNYRIGMVSRPDGFLDSPETEVISSGTCAKSIDAVAIGRHANFFHWGFSASPAYLTEAGKAALANAIVYISKFAGQHVIARKLNEGIATRKGVDLAKFIASREAWQDNIATNVRFYQAMDSIKQVIKGKLERGEELDATEKMYKDIPSRTYKAPTYAAYMKERNPKLYHIFGEDAEEYQRYYEKNRNWFRPDESGYQLDIDEDVRTLGIANNDVRLLDRCISILEQNGEYADVADRVLKRYTLCRFSTPQEWRKWYDTYREKLFFTESGGWLWLVDTQDPMVPGNDYGVLKAGQAAAENGQKAEVKAAPAKRETLVTDNKNPVALAAELNVRPDGKRELVIRVKIHTGYHIYARVADADPFIATKVEVKLPEGWQAEGDMQTPAFHDLGTTGTTVYEGEGVFRQVIAGEGEGEAECTVSYQCCDNNICFPPTEKILKVALQ